MCYSFSNSKLFINIIQRQPVDKIYYKLTEPEMQFTQ